MALVCVQIGPDFDEEDQYLQAEIFSEADVFYSPSMAFDQILTASHFAEADQFYLIRMSSDLAPSLFTESDIFFTPAVARHGEIDPALFIESDVFFTHTVASYPLEGTGPTFAASLSRDLLSTASGRYTESSGAIISILDQTGGSNHVTDGGTSTRRPALTTAGPNSRECADFDGSTDFLVDSAIGITTSDAWILMSVIFDTIDGTTRALLSDGGQIVTLFSLDSGGDKIFFQNNSGGIAQNANRAATAGTVYVLAARHEGGTIYLSVNGDAETSTASGNSNPLGNLTLGAYDFVGNLPGDGKIFEVATWSTIPDSSTRAALIADFMDWVGAT